MYTSERYQPIIAATRDRRISADWMVAMISR
jgi:hypothetical protein